MGDPANQRELSVISLAEIAMKNVAGKLSLSREDAMDALRRLHVSMLPYAEAHALDRQVEAFGAARGQPPEPIALDTTFAD